MTRALASAVVIAGVAAGCAGHRARTATVPITAAGPPVVYAAIGAGETVGEGLDNPVRDAWPQVLFRTALPASATFVNFAIPGVTISTAVDGELPEVLDVHPNLVTVWMNVTDVLNGVTPAVYASQLRALLGPLRAAGARVLVANTPPVTDLPVYAACRDASGGSGACPPGVSRPVPASAAIDAVVDGYNLVTAVVARQEGAVLVDLHTAVLRARAAGGGAGLVSADGLDPSAAGAALVAAQFAAALEASGALPPLHS